MSFFNASKIFKVHFFMVSSEWTEHLKTVITLNLRSLIAVFACPRPAIYVIVHNEPFVESFSPFSPLDVTCNVAGMRAGTCSN